MRPRGVGLLVDDYVVSVTARPGSLRADVLIVGDVGGTAAVPTLTDAVRRLSEYSPRSVFVDLAGITVAGPALPNFLIQAHNRISRGSWLVVCRPSAVARSVLLAAGVMEILTVCDNLIY